MTRLALLLFTRPATGWLWSSSKEDTEASVVPSFGEGQMARLDDLSPSSLEAALSTSGAIVMGLEAGAVDAVAAAAYAAFQRKDLDAFDGYARRRRRAGRSSSGDPGPGSRRRPTPSRRRPSRSSRPSGPPTANSPRTWAEPAPGRSFARCGSKGSYELHVAFHPAGGLEPMACAAHGESDRDVDGMGFTLDDPLKPFPGLGPKWESSEANYRVSAVSISGDPAPAPRTRLECATTEARGVRVRGRLNGDMGSALVGPPVHPCEFADFDGFLRTSCLERRRRRSGA
ncbi:hypothetical protein SO694_00028210 [Aureococcus anophagefferens]|uniref:Uncharacterized protein n=1 Tax=Aureococcus anophagefferens TaxID=44056 RepID=A0ABR1FVR3_AURAN